MAKQQAEEIAAQEQQKNETLMAYLISIGVNSRRSLSLTGAIYSNLCRSQSIQSRTLLKSIIDLQKCTRVGSVVAS